MERIIVAFVIAACSAACGGGISHEEFQQIMEEARQCEPGDTCVLAGSGQCTCPQPVNAENVDRVEEAVEDLDCMGAVVDCLALTDPRCEDGECVADPL